MKKRNIAKTALAVLSVMTIGAAGASLAACDKDGEHTHSYGKWTLITDPTLTAGGKAERYCKDNDGGKEEKDVPVLTDTSVWTENLTVKVDPTCSAEGKREFTSADYGTVTVTLAVDADVHSYGKWTLTKNPTATEQGTAVRVCGANGDHTETKTDVPVLTDTSVWTLDTEKSQAPTHTADGINVYTSAEYGEVTVPVSKSEDAHVYGGWTFVGGQPTLTAGGKIQRTCSDAACGHVEEEDVPALSDTSFWTKTETEPATHQTAGIADFANAEYGIKVEGVTVPKLAHTFGAWEITQEPTATSKGTATRTCTRQDCAEDETAVETKELPELTDAFWTKSHTAANYNSGSTDTYTNSEYGLEIKKVADDKKPAPYDDVDYYCFGYYIDSEGKLLSRTCDNLYGGPILPLDKNTATGTTYPVNGKVVINSKNPEVLNGEIDFIIDGEVYPAYYDAETKIIVLIYSSTDIKIFTPYYDIREVHKDILDENDNVTDSVIFNANFAKKDGKAATITVGNDTVFAVEYNYADGKTIGICVNEGAVTFNVKFTDLDGTASDLSAMDGYTNLFVKDADGNKVENFGYNPSTERWQVCDGFEGEYEVKYCDVNKIVVNGAGAIDCTFCNGDERSSTYKYEGVDGFGRENISTVIGKDYFVFAFDNDGKVTGMKKNVRIVFNLNGVEVSDTDELGTVNEDGNYELSVSKTVPFKLPVPLNNEKMFMGWYLDKDCKTPVELDKDGNYVPVHIYSIDFYAKWSQKHSFTLKTDADDAGTAVYFGDGEIIGKFLPDHDIDLDNWRSFDGWFVNTADGEMQINAETELSAGDDGIVVYGKWTALPVWYGEYNGASGTYDTEAHITIDKDGNVTGETRWGNFSTSQRNFTAKVQRYDAEAQTLIWSTLKDNKTVNIKVFFYASEDHATRILIMQDWYNSDTEIGGSNFLLTNGENVEFAEGGNKGIDFNALGGYTEGKTRVVKYSVDGNEKLMLIYGNKIYTDVTLENYLGEKVEHADVLNGKTLVVKQNGNIITALGTTSANLGANNAEVKLLDSFYGKYTFETAEYLIDGIGNMTDGTKTYEYEVIDENKISAFELNEEKARIAHFVVTFDNGNIASIVKEMANLTMDGVEVSINTKIPYALEDPTPKVGKVFVGWHALSDLSDEVITSITITEATEIYADWRDAISVTFMNNFGEGDTSVFKTVDAAKGMPLEMTDEPLNSVDDALFFRGWFTDAACTDGNEWKSNETVVTEAVTLYAKWAKFEMYGSYLYANVYNTSSTTGTKTATSISSKLTINAKGVMSAIPANGTADFDSDTGVFKAIGSDGKYKFGYFDNDSGIFIINYNSHDYDRFEKNDMYVGVKVGEYTDDTSTIGQNLKVSADMSFWNTTTIAYKITFTNTETNTVEKTVNAFVYKDKAYFNVSFKSADADGEDVEALNCYKAAFLYVYASDGTTLIGKFGYDGSTMKEFDGNEGTYTCEGKDDLVLSGLGTFVWGEKTGTYSAKDGGGYTMLVKDGSKIVENYVLNIEAENKTYTATENKVTVSYITAYGEKADDVVFAEAEFELPVLEEEGLLHIGWYVDDDTQLITKIAPTENVELTAKWVVPAAMAGTYKGWNLYNANESGTKTIASLSYSFNLTALGAYSGKQLSDGKLSEEDSAKTSGAINVGRYAYVDKSVGVVWYAWTASNTSVNNDTLIFFNTELVKSVDYSGMKGDGPYVFWATVHFVDESKPDVNIFGYNNVIHVGVSWGDIDVTKCNVTNHIVKDSSGTDIAVMKDGHIVPLDGYQGTYTSNDITIVIDGGGSLTVGDSTVADAYTAVDGKLIFTHNNQMHVITLDKAANTFAFVQDGYAGTYTLPDGTTKITLDGLGGAGDGKTYVVNGTSIAVYDGDAVTNYGIDVANKLLLGKSIFAGLTFRHGTDNYHFIEFEDGVEIKGTFKFQFSFYAEFKGDLVGNKLTLTVTKDVGNMSGGVGKTFVFDVSKGKITLTSEGTAKLSDDAKSGWEYACADFSFAG